MWSLVRLAMTELGWLLCLVRLRWHPSGGAASLESDRDCRVCSPKAAVGFRQALERW